MIQEKIVLVNPSDEEIGLMDKLEAHQKGLLHRAISVFIFNTAGQLLLQQRQHDKYHSGGLWTNTCCSHPFPNESVATAAQRRLWEEMGIQTPLKHIYQFQYFAHLDKGLIEHELDHVFYGITDQAPQINPEEAADFRFVHPTELDLDMRQNPQNYTEWFKICLPEVLRQLA
ncbi:isopentenyl-diphosphate delta-isomerase [Dyadobacter jejuensis]|uniref:Isopentenyl-diphosphate delta-isomerase n=1 Tax=Dyadobacter jejuensis TaxID=1082580 RepID=A0A316ANF7_9BACT|nr:isopentenyl-diphosphate Delta-isomerase [Dyadobacter jejuensis]PWJ59072.1 isopentenyl-diphosphate delta-isomerase [Dyadobacter jejuensis]